MPVKSNNDSIWTDNYIDDNIVVNNIVNGIETQNDGKIIDTKKNMDDSNANKKDDDILNFYMQCKNNCKIGLLNINSLRHKFYPIMHRGGSRMVGALRQTTWWGPLRRVRKKKLA